MLLETGFCKAITKAWIQSYIIQVLAHKPGMRQAEQEQSGASQNERTPWRTCFTGSAFHFGNICSNLIRIWNWTGNSCMALSHCPGFQTSGVGFLQRQPGVCLGGMLSLAGQMCKVAHVGAPGCFCFLRLMLLMGVGTFPNPSFLQKGARHVSGPSGPCHADRTSRPSGEVSHNKISPLPAQFNNLSVSLKEVIGLVASILSL